MKKAIASILLALSFASACLAGDGIEQIGFVAASSADIVTSSINFCRKDDGIREANPLAFKNPYGAAAVIGGTSAYLFFYSRWMLHTHRKRTARAFLLAGIALHGYAAFHNSRLR